MQETLEACHFDAQTLSGNCPHTDVASADKHLEVCSVVDGTANFGTSECSWLDGAYICNNMVFQFSWIDMVFAPINSIVERCGT